MRYLPVSGFPVIDPEDADSELARHYQEVQRETDLPFVPSWAKLTLVSPNSMEIYMEMYRAFKRYITLPDALVPMILYTIATARDCTYCSAANELYCRTLGVDEETLEKMANDLGNVSPRRLRAIIEFAF